MPYTHPNFISLSPATHHPIPMLTLLSRSVRSPPWIFPFGQRHGRLAVGATVRLATVGAIYTSGKNYRYRQAGWACQTHAERERHTRWRTGGERTCRV